MMQPEREQQLSEDRRTAKNEQQQQQYVMIMTQRAANKCRTGKVHVNNDE